MTPLIITGLTLLVFVIAIAHVMKRMCDRITELRDETYRSYVSNEVYRNLVIRHDRLSDTFAALLRYQGLRSQYQAAHVEIVQYVKYEPWPKAEQPSESCSFTDNTTP